MKISKMIGLLRLMVVTIALITLLTHSAFGQDPESKKKKHQIIIPFSEALVPLAPDYSQESSWASLPWITDAADLLPVDSLNNGEDSAKVDVFYIHPTTFSYGPNWNAAIDDKKVNKNTDKWPLKHQASVFNGSCRVFAPRYRQSHIRGFYNLENGGTEALEIAYQDVKTAFQYYMDHYNNGRPVIIAGHSQGSFHGNRLLKEFFDGTDLQKQLVAAFLPGFPIHISEFKSIEVCANPSETGCLVSWMTFREGYYPGIYDKWVKGSVSVNPVSWTSDSAIVDYSNHKGLLVRRFSKLVPEVYNVQAVDGMVWISEPMRHYGVMGRFLSSMKNYHIVDYNLFWSDIRNSVKEKTDFFILPETVRESSKGY